MPRPVAAQPGPPGTAEVVEDEQVDGHDAAHLLLVAVVQPGCLEPLEQPVGAFGVDAYAAAAGNVAEGVREVGLADPDRAEDERALVRLDEPEGREFVVPRFQAHLDEFVSRRADALAFTTPTGRRIHLSNFHRDVWEPAREKMFAEGSPLRRVRRHDLRHAAITAWLNVGVLLKTAQRWSGHRTASVLLDTYLGVMRDDLATSVTRIEEALTGAQENSESVTDP